MKLKIGVIYKITYPNGKIYIGQDRTDDVNYFGSADSFTIANDFTHKQKMDFCVRKQILIRKKNIEIAELNKLESYFIRKHRANDPLVGYNRTGVRRRVCKTLFTEKT